MYLNAHKKKRKKKEESVPYRCEYVWRNYTQTGNRCVHCARMAKEVNSWKSHGRVLGWGGREGPFRRAPGFYLQLHAYERLH